MELERYGGNTGCVLKKGQNAMYVAEMRSFM